MVATYCLPPLSARCEFPYIVTNLPLTVSKTEARTANNKISARIPHLCGEGQPVLDTINAFRACKVGIQEEVKQFQRPAVRSQAFDRENKLLLPD